MSNGQNGGASPRRRTRILAEIGGLLVADAVVALSPAPTFASDPPKGCSRSHQRKANRWGSVIVAPPTPAPSPAPAPPPAQVGPPSKPGRPAAHPPRSHRKTSLREGAPGMVPQATELLPIYRSC